MNERPTIRQQMDACRPDSDDLHLPDFAADLAELHGSLRDSGEVCAELGRIQQNDRIIRSAMHDVSLPAGLEAKLLAATQASQTLPASELEQPDQHKAASERNPVISLARANRRRFITAVGVLTATAALVLVGVITFRSFSPADQSITRDQLASDVEEWLRTVDVRAMTRPTKANQSPPGGFVLGAIAGSSSIPSTQEKITAYSVTQRGNRAILLVIPTKRAYPVGTLPFTKLGISGGWQVGAWQREGILFVIAVPENARFDDFIRPQPIG